MRHRSSVLNLLDENCPWALVLHDQGIIPAERRHFHTGTAAHLFCQAVGELWEKAAHHTESAWESVLDAVTEELPARLMSEGYRFDDGQPEILAPRNVAEGMKIALGYLRDRVLSDTAWYEQGLGVDEHGQAVDYNDPKAYVVALIDVRDVLPWSPDGEEEYTGAHVTDYKTAWPAGENELTSLQRKIQLVLARAHHPEVDFVQGHVVNLRTGMTHDTQRFWLRNEQDMDVLDEYWMHIKAVCKAADMILAKGDDIELAQPGVHCIGCRYVLSCDANSAIRHRRDLHQATVYAATKAYCAELEKWVRQIVGTTAVEASGGLVGFQAKDVDQPQDDAYRKVVREFLGAPDDPVRRTRWDADHADIMSMVKALNLGKGNLEALAKWLWPSPREGGYEDFKERREEFLQDTTFTKTRAQFGVWPIKES